MCIAMLEPPGMSRLELEWYAFGLRSNVASPTSRSSAGWAGSFSGEGGRGRGPSGFPPIGRTLSGDKVTHSQPGYIPRNQPYDGRQGYVHLGASKQGLRVVFARNLA